MALDARHRRGAFGHAGRGDSGHAGVAVAGHARPAQGRPGGAAAGVEHEGGGGAEATGDKGGRGGRRELHRRRRRAGRHAPRGGRLEGAAAAAHPCGEAHPHRLPRHPFLRARHRDRSRGALHPEDLQEGGDQQQEQAPVRHHGHGVTKTAFILVATLLLDKVGRRPLLLTSVAGMILSLSSLGFGLTMADHSQQKLPWALGLCIVSCCSSWPSSPSAWRPVMNGTVSMTFLSLQRHHHRWCLLPLRRHCNLGLDLLLLLLPRDQGGAPGEDRGGLQQGMQWKLSGRGRRSCHGECSFSRWSPEIIQAMIHGILLCVSSKPCKMNRK
ncbi:Transporter [Musa troglodytarum]|uniref:Transporter n=1 Tax=Musa troglodytarum TaxID=320322 RepID=A0A9E7EGX8_9LILI|nr:Transporter [Musa troglodytarum]